MPPPEGSRSGKPRGHDKENQPPAISSTNAAIDQRVVRVSGLSGHIKEAHKIENATFWNSPAEHIPVLRETPALESNALVERPRPKIAKTQDNMKLREDTGKATHVQPLVTKEAVRLNTVVWKDSANVPRPAVQKKESQSILNLGQKMEEMVIGNERPAVSGVGLGEIKRGDEIVSKYFDPNRKPRPPKPRIPSWKADATAPEAKVDESIVKILQFLQGVSDDDEDTSNDDVMREREKKFKVFLDANKEIVKAWHELDDELFKGPQGVALGEKVDCIHAILVVWNKDVATQGAWVKQALELSEHCVGFATDWERLTGRKMVAAPDLKVNLMVDEKPLEKPDNNEKMEYIAPPTLSPQVSNMSHGAQETWNNTEESILVGNTSLSPQVCKVSHTTVETQSFCIGGLPLTARPHQNNIKNSDQEKSTMDALINPDSPSERYRPKLQINKPSDISSAILREHLRSCTSLSPAPIEDALYFHDRLERIEYLLSQPTSQHAMTITLNQQITMIQEIRDMICGQWDKINPEQNADKRVIAKRTGLLMMSKFMSDWKDEYGVKIGRIENAVCGKKGDTNAGLIGACKRIEDNVGTFKQIDPEKVNEDEEKKINLWKSWALEDENKKLKDEIQKLSVHLALEAHHDDLTEKIAIKNENKELKKEVQVLKDSLRSALIALMQEKEQQENSKLWADEDWDVAMEMCWPQGNPTFESGKPEQQVTVDVSAPSATMVIESGKPIIHQASRGESWGGAGQCIVM
ncbi:hypothetical protein G7Y89_g11240 [Cudoniella acicularis]|uniref:Uncharacterized protein n=1 Tax=Cudoniella acicularis TaxID=354080 RepID=A0A8H4REU9_9HELO|nr:hypothetical protein G7Y89_g11240 [Cudoniella acicularis]